MGIDAICLIICLVILGISSLIFILHGVALRKEWEKGNDYCSFEEQKDEYEPVFWCKDCKYNGTWFCPVNEQAGKIMQTDDKDYCSWGAGKGDVEK